MSKLFYDHLIVFQEVEKHIKRAESFEEKEELWQLVDELIHQRVLACILDVLPKKDHFNFLERFYTCPYDDGLIDFINERIKEDIEELIACEIDKLSREILLQLRR